jgi:CubicO group peptidase (beta-lactamase class C family)
MHAPPFARALCLAGLAGLLLARPAPGEDLDANKLGAVRARMQSFVDQGDIAGAVTVVGTRGGVAGVEAVGLMSIEKNQPMRKDALFRIASMTKPITAAGILILADEGKLSVDDPVEKYLPEFKGQMLVAEKSKDAVTLKKPSRPIVLKDLLTHTSGLPAGPPVGLADLYRKRNHTLAEGVIAFSQQPLQFEPGSQWSYCNAGIDTLGRVIEVVSGQPYEEFLRQRIFTPLGMTDTTFYPSAEQWGRTATVYNKTNGKLVADPNLPLDLPAGSKYPVPAGGLFSTGADLAKFYQMMLNQGSLGSVKILSPAAVEAMTKAHTKPEHKVGFVPGMGFGLGVGVVREPQGVTAMLSPGSFGHGGAYGTQGWMDPKQDLFLVMLIQRTGLQNGDASPMRQAFQEAAVAALRK